MWEIGDRFSGHAGEVTALATALVDGRRVVVSGGGDKTVRLWDPAAGASVGAPLTGHLSAVNAVATIELDGRPHAVSASSDGTARVWDLASGRQVSCLGRHPARDTSTIPVWKVMLGSFGGQGLHQVFAAATARAGADSVVVVGGEDGVQVWDPATGEARGAPLTGDLVTHLVTVTVDGRAVAVTSGPAGPIRFWDLESGAPTVVLPWAAETDGAVMALAAGVVDGQSVVLTARFHPRRTDRSVQLWDAATGLPIGDPVEVRESSSHLLGPMAITVLDGRPCGVVCVGIPPGRGMLRAWDLATGEILGASQTFPSLLSAMIPYPDGPDGSLVVGFGSDLAILNPR